MWIVRAVNNVIAWNLIKDKIVTIVNIVSENKNIE